MTQPKEHMPEEKHIRAIMKELRLSAKAYLNDLQHSRLPDRKSFDEPLINPQLDMGIEMAWKTTQEILQRCSLSAFEVDQIRIVNAALIRADLVERMKDRS